MPGSTEGYPPALIRYLARSVALIISKPLWFIRYKGLENLPKQGPGGFILAANHQTYIDPAWLGTPIRHKVRYMAVEQAFKWRFIGPLISYLGAFPVPSNTAGTIRSMKMALRTLREGSVLVVFPEGAREFADGKLLPFKDGVVRLAAQAGVPIVPATISGGNRIWPRNQRYPRLFRRVTITYHPLMTVDETGDPERATERLREVIISGLTDYPSVADG